MMRLGTCAEDPDESRKDQSTLRDTMVHIRCTYFPKNTFRPSTAKFVRKEATFCSPIFSFVTRPLSQFHVPQVYDFKGAGSPGTAKYFERPSVSRI